MGLYCDFRMPKKNRYLPEGVHDYFITARCANKEWFRRPMDEVWGMLQDQLYFLHKAFDVQVRAAVLMSNHYHLIATVDSILLPSAMRHMQHELARELNRRAGRINQVWGKPYHSTLISTHSHFRNVYKYLYRNPVRAGVCPNVESYSYSAIRGLIGLERIIAPIFDAVLMDDIEEGLRWLNSESLSNWEVERLRSALRRSRFQLPREESSPLAYLNSEAP